MPRFAAAFLFVLLFTVAGFSAGPPPPPDTVEQWGAFELALAGPSGGNPFDDVSFSAVFSDGTTAREAAGFYDGGGIYRVRFMPDRPGRWTYATRSNRPELDGRTGGFAVTAPGPGNHGPVTVSHTYHFAYADGTPYRPIGTTCYTWTHRPEELQDLTLRTLAASPFNKLRMAVFPQTHGIAGMPPVRWPFAGTPGHFDRTRPNPEFFQALEKRIARLRELGIECDLILFHPYGDRKAWGFDAMDRAGDERYVRYVVARLASCRNVWWSLANEYDFIKTKTEDDWDHLFQVVQAADPSGHLRSIHNGYRLYDNRHPWVTHASVQNGAAVADAGRAELFREVWRKPVVFDEVKYEGDGDQRWGRLSGPELVHRFWSGFVAGTYVGHSEFFKDPQDIVWLGQGGVLKGESPARLAFLRQVLEAGPKDGIDPIDAWSDPHGDRDFISGPEHPEAAIGGQPGEYYLVYFGRAAPTAWTFGLPAKALHDGMTFQAELLDTWAMTVTPVPGVFTVKAKNRYTFADAAQRTVTLPGRPGMALRLRRVP